jgi:hypothetical protein
VDAQCSGRHQPAVEAGLCNDSFLVEQPSHGPAPPLVFRIVSVDLRAARGWVALEPGSPAPGHGAARDHTGLPFPSTRQGFVRGSGR